MLRLFIQSSFLTAFLIANIPTSVAQQAAPTQASPSDEYLPYNHEPSARTDDIIFRPSIHLFTPRIHCGKKRFETHQEIER